MRAITYFADFSVNATIFTIEWVMANKTMFIWLVESGFNSLLICLLSGFSATNSSYLFLSFLVLIVTCIAWYAYPFTLMETLEATFYIQYCCFIWKLFKLKLKFKQHWLSEIMASLNWSEYEMGPYFLVQLWQSINEYCLADWTMNSKTILL